MKINSQLLSARKADLDSLIQTAISVENFEERLGMSPNELVLKAKKSLGLKESDNLIVEYDVILKQKYKLLNAFRNLVNAKYDLKDSGLLLEESELDTLNKIENKLSSLIANQFDLQVEDLYEEV